VVVAFVCAFKSRLARHREAVVSRVQVDSKKELEKQVKASCEAFIMAVTKLTVEPMLSFITKVTAVKVAMLSSSKRLREQV